MPLGQSLASQFIQSLFLDPPRKKSPYAKQGISRYQTDLNPVEEMMFQFWQQRTLKPGQWTDGKSSDYDMRGYFKAMISGDPLAKPAVNPDDNRIHFPDRWKTPYHETFSNESIYSADVAPMWKETPDEWVLISPSGRIIKKEKKQKQPKVETAKRSEQFDNNVMIANSQFGSGISSDPLKTY